MTGIKYQVLQCRVMAAAAAAKRSRERGDALLTASLNLCLLYISMALVLPRIFWGGEERTFLSHAVCVMGRYFGVGTMDLHDVMFVL